MNGFWRLCGFIVYVVACLAILLIVTAAIVQTQGDTTARYIEQQRQETIREQARQETERVRSVEWNATLRTWGTWGGGALAVGIFESFASFWSGALKDAIVFGLLIPVLILRSYMALHVDDEIEELDE